MTSHRNSVCKDYNSMNNHLIISGNVPCIGVGYYRASGRCYYISTHPATWWAAQRLCVTLGGALADIPSADARLDLKALLNAYAAGSNQFWIGLTKARWKWTTGTLSSLIILFHFIFLLDHGPCVGPLIAPILDFVGFRARVVFLFALSLVLHFTTTAFSTKKGVHCTSMYTADLPSGHPSGKQRKAGNGRLLTWEAVRFFSVFFLHFHCSFFKLSKNIFSTLIQ